VDRWVDVLGRHVPPGDPDHPHRLWAARDREAVERILVLGPGRGGLAGELASNYPGGRVTWLPVGGEPEGRAAALGAEVLSTPADPARWLRGRRFHYSAVVADPEEYRRLGSLLDRYQPQAVRIDHGHVDEMTRGLEGSGVVDEVTLSR
jgi:hypothetical protein